MYVGLVVQQTIAIMRMQRCRHEWRQLNPQEEQCQHCRVIVTPAGRLWVERQSNNKEQTDG